MNYKISAARKFLGKECYGEHLCCSCGNTRANNKISKALKTTFTDFMGLILSPSDYICDSCLSLYNNKDMRFKIIYSDVSGEYTTIERPDVLNVIMHPPKKFVLSVPYSFKKHHWLYAGLSTDKYAIIGTDNRSVIVDYQKCDIEELIENVQSMCAWGVPRSEIIAGKYSVFTLSKFPAVEKIEQSISEYRQQGLVELIVKYTPAQKTKKIYEDTEEIEMLTNEEKNAVNLLGAIAQGSEFRIERGLDFWGGFFERRINRFKNLEPHEFVSKLAESVGTNHNSGYQSMIKDINEKELDGIMDTIRNKTHLIVALTYSERNRNK